MEFRKEGVEKLKAHYQTWFDIKVKVANLN